jgi:hypothetical protein
MKFFVGSTLRTLLERGLLRMDGYLLRIRDKKKKRSVQFYPNEAPQLYYAVLLPVSKYRESLVADI